MSHNPLKTASVVHFGNYKNNIKQRKESQYERHSNSRTSSHTYRVIILYNSGDAMSSNHLIQLDTLKVLSSCLAVTSKDITRYPLTFIRLTPVEDQKVMIDACNGHTMVRLTVLDLGLFDLVTELACNDRTGLKALYLSKDNIKRLETIIKINRREKRVIVRNYDLGPLEDHSILSFPNLDTVTPKKESLGPLEVVCLSFNLLSNIETVIKTINKNSHIKMSFTKKDGPIVIETNIISEVVVNFKAVLMPLKNF